MSNLKPEVLINCVLIKKKCICLPLLSSIHILRRERDRKREMERERERERKRERESGGQS